jgi:hypothetical protein
MLRIRPESHFYFNETSRFGKQLKQCAGVALDFEVLVLWIGHRDHFPGMQFVVNTAMTLQQLAKFLDRHQMRGRRQLCPV